MSKEKTYGVKWRTGQTEADVIDARWRFSIANAAAISKRRWVGGLDPQLEADLRTCMATGDGFEWDYSRAGEPPSFDDDGRPIER